MNSAKPAWAKELEAQVKALTARVEALEKPKPRRQPKKTSKK